MVTMEYNIHITFKIRFSIVILQNKHHLNSQCSMFLIILLEDISYSYHKVYLHIHQFSNIHSDISIFITLGLHFDFEHPNWNYILRNNYDIILKKIQFFFFDTKLKNHYHHEKRFHIKEHKRKNQI